MDLRPYVDNIHRQLVGAAESGGDDVRLLAERLMAPLDAAIRLTLQDVVAAATEEITCELAPGSVELRLRGRDLEFVVTSPGGDPLAGDLSSDAARPNGAPEPMAAAADTEPLTATEGDDIAMSRINLRLPDHVKSRIEQAAGRDGLSVNAWLVRAATTALERSDPGRRREPRAAFGAGRYTGWAR